MLIVEVLKMRFSDINFVLLQYFSILLQTF